MKERPILFSAPMVRAILGGTKTQTRRVCKGQRERSSSADFQIGRCPYGLPGDRLWVRESWSTHTCFDDVPPMHLTTRSLHYFADGDCQTGRKRPSIHMPRWASRITLEVTGIRVERLNDISEEDAIAEGVYKRIGDCALGNVVETPFGHEAIYLSRGQAKMTYIQLWESINGIGSWAANPLVWIIEFRRLA